MTKEEIETFAKKLGKDNLAHFMLVDSPDKNPYPGSSVMEGFNSTYGKHSELFSMFLGAMHENPDFADLLMHCCVHFGMDKLKEKIAFEEARAKGNIN